MSIEFASVKCTNVLVIAQSRCMEDTAGATATTVAEFLSDQSPFGSWTMDVEGRVDITVADLSPGWSQWTDSMLLPSIKQDTIQRWGWCWNTKKIRTKIRSPSVCAPVLMKRDQLKKKLMMTTKTVPISKQSWLVECLEQTRGHL